MFLLPGKSEMVPVVFVFSKFSYIYSIRIINSPLILKLLLSCAQFCAIYLQHEIQHYQNPELLLHFLVNSDHF